MKIEITSWKARAYGIFTRVGEVSEIERVSAANEWDFWYKTNECENPVQSAFHAVISIFRVEQLIWLSIFCLIDLRGSSQHMVTFQTRTLAICRND